MTKRNYGICPKGCREVTCNGLGCRGDWKFWVHEFSAQRVCEHCQYLERLQKVMGRKIQSVTVQTGSGSWQTTYEYCDNRERVPDYWNCDLSGQIVVSAFASGVLMSGFGASA